jgi:P27 family predicted phage terminase small subunit
LATARLLTAENLPSLEALCSIYATARQADAILQRDGLTMTVGENGYIQQRPEVSISHKHWALFRQYGDAFGLSPAGARRLGLEIPIDDEDDEFTGFISTV